MVDRDSGQSARWERMARKDRSLVFRDRRTGATLTHLSREPGDQSPSGNGVCVLLSRHLLLMGTFECRPNDGDPPLEQADCAIRDWSASGEEEAGGPTSVDFHGVYSLPADD